MPISLPPISRRRFLTGSLAAGAGKIGPQAPLPLGSMPAIAFHDLPPASVRLDKWLWAVRVFKTRSQAAQACQQGRITIAGRPAKPAHSVNPNELILATSAGLTHALSRCLACWISASGPNWFPNSPPTSLPPRNMKGHGPPARRRCSPVPRASAAPPSGTVASSTSCFEAGSTVAGSRSTLRCCSPVTLAHRHFSAESSARGLAQLMRPLGSQLAMAAKTKTFRLVRQAPASCPTPVRRQPAKPSGLYLVELRANASPAELPRRKLTVNVKLQHAQESFPKSVKISHA